MDGIREIGNWLEQNLLLISLISIGLNILVFILFLRANLRLKKYRTLLINSEGSDLEHLLLSLLDKTDIVFKKQEKIEEQIINNQILEEKHLQNWNLVRFQAFQNTGGDQSFALALLDALGDGVVMSSIFGREEARVYCKPVQGGTSSYPLSDEEKEAILKATGKAKK